MKRKPKNVILIMTDQQRADGLGCTGNPILQTPNLDRLGQGGAVLRNHQTPHQICSPSRATLFSGLFARNHGLTRNGVALPEEKDLVTHALQRAGMKTHGIGKFHFQPILAGPEHRMPDSNAFWESAESKDWRGPFYGFDTVDMLIGESVASVRGGHYAAWLKDVAPHAVALYQPENALFGPLDDLDEVWKSAIPDELHYNTWITDRACAFLESQEAQDSFFLMVSYPDPHHPFAPPRPWCDMYDPADIVMPDVVDAELTRMPGYVSESESTSYLNYLRTPGKPREQGFMVKTDTISETSLRMAIAHTYGMISMIDACVGRILCALQDSGSADETMIVFTADHGELLGDHGLLRKGPSPYTQLLNVPCIFNGPGIVAGERTQLTSHLDMRSTILELCDIPHGGDEGRSFADVLRDPGAAGRDSLFAEYHHRSRPETYNQSIITPEWRLTTYPNHRDWGELFDRRNDPGEHHNLFNEEAYSSIRNQLLSKIRNEFPSAPDAGGEAIAVY